MGVVQRESMKRGNERRKNIPGVRVLFFGHTAALGGGEIALLNLLRNLDYKKVRPIVVLGAEGPLAEQLSPIVPTYIVPLSPHVAKAKKDTLGMTTLTLSKPTSSEELPGVYRCVRLFGTFATELRMTTFLDRLCELSGSCVA
jgi:hypothetical protein